MSFRHRLALVSAVAVAVAVVVGSIVAYALVRGSLRGEIDDSLRQTSNRRLFTTRPPPALGDITKVVPTTGERQGVLVRFLTLNPSAEHPHMDEAMDGMREVAEGTREPFFADAELDGAPVRTYTTQLRPGTATQFIRPLGEVNSTLGRLRVGLALAALAGIGLAAFLGRLAARTAVRPVTRLTETAEDVARTGDLSRRIEARGDDELARLAGSFNAMLAGLEESRRAQRQLVADASHELRTPLTSLRTNLEVLGQPNGLTTRDRERLRADVLAQLTELTELVGDLMELARADEPQALQREDLRLDELLAHAVERARRHAPGVEFGMELQPSIVSADRARLDRAVGNLLDNAAKWSPPGSRVDVRVGGGEITVRDHGPGIAPEDLPHVFDRFYRAASARGGDGSGLGLAIVRRAAEAHGGHVSAEAAPGGGALLRLSLPAG